VFIIKVLLRSSDTDTLQLLLKQLFDGVKTVELSCLTHHNFVSFVAIMHPCRYKLAELRKYNNCTISV